MILYPLLSNNRINNILSIPYDFSDPELVSYFVAVLRALAFKMTSLNVILFISVVVCLKFYIFVYSL